MPFSVAADLRLNPFLHVDVDRIYNRHTDRALVRGDEEFALLRSFIDGGAPHEALERRGWLDVGLKPPAKKQNLAGCNNVGSRPVQHLHITPRGKGVLCCEDCDERYAVGDLDLNSIDEILRGDEIVRLRRWVYGIEEAPADFICRNCLFARER